jgi:hypothetical protein
VWSTGWNPENGKDDLLSCHQKMEGSNKKVSSPLLPTESFSMEGSISRKFGAILKMERLSEEEG